MEPFTQNEILKFWSRQTSEHLLICALGLANEIRTLSPEEETIPTLKFVPRAAQLRSKALTLSEIWKKISENLPSSDFDLTSLFQDTLTLQNDIADHLYKDEWIGWLSIGFIDHITIETNYFIRKYKGETFKSPEEIKFWIAHHGSETGYSSKLIDISEKDLNKTLGVYILKVENIQDSLKNLEADEDIYGTEVENILYEFLDNNTHLLNLLTRGDVFTNLSIDMVKHVIREAQWAIRVFQWNLKQ